MGVVKYSSNDLYNSDLDDITRRMLYNGCDTAITMDLYKNHLVKNQMYEKIRDYVSNVLKNNIKFDVSLKDLHDLIELKRNNLSGLKYTRKEMISRGLIKEKEVLPKWKFLKLLKNASTPEDREFLKLVINDMKIEKECNVLQAMCVGKPFRLVPNLFMMQFDLKLDGTFYNQIPFQDNLDIFKGLNPFNNFEFIEQKNPIIEALELLTGSNYSKVDKELFTCWVMGVGPIVTSRETKFTVAEVKEKFNSMIDEYDEIEKLKMEVFTSAYESGEITNPYNGYSFKVSKQLHRADIESDIFKLLIDNTLLMNYLEIVSNTNSLCLIHKNTIMKVT